MVKWYDQFINWKHLKESAQTRLQCLLRTAWPLRMATDRFNGKGVRLSIENYGSLNKGVGQMNFDERNHKKIQLVSQFLQSTHQWWRSREWEVCGNQPKKKKNIQLVPVMVTTLGSIISVTKAISLHHNHEHLIATISQSFFILTSVKTHLNVVLKNKATMIVSGPFSLR